MIVYMEGCGIGLEIFIDANHPAHITNPEAFGLRHLAFKVDSVKKTLKKLGIEAEPIRVSDGKCFLHFSRTQMDCKLSCTSKKRKNHTRVCKT